jgi:ribonuclease HII
MPSRKSSPPEQLGLPLPELPRTRGALPRRRTRVLPGLVAGVDEAGRGPLAGPVVAAAVILDELRPIRGLADSKALTPARREHLFETICAQALCVSIAQASVEEIDRLNILQATLLAMQRAVAGLRLAPQQVWVDGNRAPVLTVPVHTLVQGDAKMAAISAASILAKVQRDRLCVALHAAHPQYGFDVHKGYPTPAHLAALRAHGACAVHRRSFAPVRACLGGSPAAAGHDTAAPAAPAAPAGERA